MRVGNLNGRHQPGAYLAEGIAAFTLVPGAAALYLVFAFRYVVDHAIASHIVQRLRFFYITRLAAYDHAQLDFPVGLYRIARHDHRLVGTGRCGPLVRSEERRVGKAGVSTCRSRW